jgi:hypothetical protein
MSMRSATCPRCMAESMGLGSSAGHTNGEGCQATVHPLILAITRAALREIREGREAVDTWESEGGR